MKLDKSLFDHAREKQLQKESPLAARMRPRTLDEFVGQADIIGPGRLLRRAIQADRLGSLVLYGPPGTGKTTLARVIANSTEAEFIALNAVLSGVKDIRAAIARAKQIRGEQGRRTLLFIDEVHRFNKAQQDALLPWVESGTVTLIGATTENPYFEVNKALVSRSRIFRLEPLGDDDLRQVVERALSEPERGYGEQQVSIADAALEHLVNVANGDARALLNALELAVETTPPDDEGAVHVTLEVAEESIQRRAVLYDKEGDAHFDTISAFIKSCRGSDPDAALYWLGRMVYAGEDPRYLFRRLIILASEDVGLADPDVLPRVMACAEAFDRIGLPEGRFPLAQATLLIATAPKSNSTMGFFEALKAVAKEREGEVPDGIKDPSRDGEGFGHGEGYLYPHAYRDHWVAQQYLPSALVGRVFYEPSDQGFEAGIRQDVARRREAQIAALDLGEGDDWLRRAVEDAGQQLGDLRDRVFELAEVESHHVVLDLRAQSGLLTWEAVRRAPDGGVFAAARAARLEKLRAQSRSLPELDRPRFFVADCASLSDALAEHAEGVRFDRVVGLDPIDGADDIQPLAAALTDVLAGRLVIAQTIYREGQRLSALAEGLEPSLRQRWRDAEEAVYGAEDPRFTWDADALRAYFEAVDVAELERQVHVTPALHQRWWSGEYRDRLRLSEDDVDALSEWTRRWVGRSLPWRRTVAWIRSSASALER